MFHYLLFGVKKALIVFLLVLVSSKIFGQLSISGAKCVSTTLVYQYHIKNVGHPNDKITICVEGGILLETGTACIEKNNISSIRLRWDKGISTGKLTVSSQAGSDNLSVNIVPPFNPGLIETMEKQTIVFNKLPHSLSCTKANGGNCSPSFSYQWEQSPNKVKWIPVSDAKDRNLLFVIPLKQTTFFRRKVVEIKSGTIGYSNAVIVFVTPEIIKR